MNENEKQEIYKKIEKSIEARIVSIEKRLSGNKSWIKSNLLHIIIIVGAILATWFQTQTQIALLKADIATIKDNHLVHIQTALEKEVSRNDNQDKQISDICIKLERLITILEKK